MEYERSDFWERMERGRRASEDFVRSVQDARESPLYALHRIDEGQRTNRLAMEIALKMGYQTETVETAFSCLRLLRELRPLFETLQTSVFLKPSDEDANDYLVGLSEMQEEDEAVKTLLSTKEMPPSRLSNFIARWEARGTDAGLRPLQVKSAVAKLRQLQARITGK